MSLNPVSKMCGAGNVVTFAVEGDTIKNLWTGASMHFGRKSGVYVLNTRVKKGSARRNIFCQAGNVISRASRAVSPLLEQVSDAEEVQEIEESPSNDEEQDQCVLLWIDDESEIERERRPLRRQRHSHRLPTSSEMKEHLRTHLPYRSWCQHCVSGRGVGTQRRRRNPGEDSVEVAIVAVDHCFFRNTPGEESIPVLVMRDPETRLLAAHAVPMKGAVVEWTAQQDVRHLERLGHHGRLVIRCDQDAALKSLVSEAARMRGGRCHDFGTLCRWRFTRGTASLSVQ